MNDYSDLNSTNILRVLSSTDLWLRITGVITTDEFKRILNGQLNVMIIFEVEFKRRFPVEYAIWLKENDQ